jgi:phosphoribosylaminoimidazole (AIR) synthetase
MYRVFNMGIGMVAFLPAACDLTQLPQLGAVPIGEVRERTVGAVELGL